MCPPFPTINLYEFDLDRDVVELIPLEISLRYPVVAVNRVEDTLIIATVLGRHEAAGEAVAAATGLTLALVIATEAAIRDVLDRTLGGEAAESERFVRRDAEAGDPDAVIRLAERDLHGMRGGERDPDEAERLLLRAARCGSSRAMMILGRELCHGQHLPHRPETGQLWLREAALRGNDEAMVLLGERLLFGEGCRDLEQGELWLRRALELGNGEAMLPLGRALITDLLPARPWVSRDGELGEGEHLLRTAAARGRSDALVFLGDALTNGERYEVGERILRDLADQGSAWAMGALGWSLLERRSPARVCEARSWLRRAVLQNDTWAITRLGQELVCWSSIPEEWIEGERFLRVSIARDDPVAMRCLGIHLTGIVFPHARVNREEGDALIRQAAELGDSAAMTVLAEDLLDEPGPRAEAARVEAIALLRRALAVGPDHAKRRMLLALALGPGEPEALSALERAVELGGEPRARALLRAYRGEELADEEVADELPLLRKAAAAGAVPAMASVGRHLLRSGEDPEEGRRLLGQAIERGSVGAMTTLGRHLLGSGAVEEGIAILRRAVEQGDARAMYLLGSFLIESGRDAAEGQRLLAGHWRPAAAGRADGR